MRIITCCRSLLLALVGAGLLLPSLGAQAEIYKWVDEDGNVTYLDKPPPSAQGKVEKKKIDPNRNVIQGHKPAPPATSPSARPGSAPLEPPQDAASGDNDKRLPGALADNPGGIDAPSPLAPVPVPGPAPVPPPPPVNPPGMP